MYRNLLSRIANEIMVTHVAFSLGFSVWAANSVPATGIVLARMDPVERVFLEDVARRGLGRFLAVANGYDELSALCHAGANLVPSGVGCGLTGRPSMKPRVSAWLRR